MRYAGILLVAMFVLIGLSGCGTPAFRNASSECQNLAANEIPANYQQTTVNKVRYETVPDGNITCPPPVEISPSVPANRLFSSQPAHIYQPPCSQGTRRIEIPYTEVVSVDLNESRRQQFVNSCVSSRCNRGGLKDKSCSGGFGSYKSAHTDQTSNRRSVYRTETYAGGDVYTGRFLNGEKHGQGTYDWADGSQYIGKWKHDNMHGQGTYNWGDGKVYIGEFLNGEKHGQGTIANSDGEKYVGSWKYGKFNGLGTYIRPDGQKYVGGFKDGKMHGTGELHTAGEHKFKFTVNHKNGKRIY